MGRGITTKSTKDAKGAKRDCRVARGLAPRNDRKGGLLPRNDKFRNDRWVGDYVGLPFRFRGRSRAGVDCYGLIWLVFWEVFGVRLPDYIARYGPAPSRDILGPLFADGAKDFCWVEEQRPAAGRVILLNLSGKPLHCGLMVDEGRMLHALEGANSCVERIDRLVWKRRHAGYFRHIESGVHGRDQIAASGGDALLAMTDTGGPDGSL